MFNEGISRSGDLLDTAVEKKVVNKAGAFYTYKTTKLGQGRENAKKFLEQNQKVFEDLKVSLTLTKKEKENEKEESVLPKLKKAA